MVRTWEDDIDGGPAVENVTFALRGVEYEVDLSEKNLKRLEEALEDFMIAGREVDPASRERILAQAEAFIQAQRASAPGKAGAALAIGPPKPPGDLPGKAEAEYVRLEFDKPASGGEPPSPVHSEPPPSETGAAQEPAAVATEQSPVQSGPAEPARKAAAPASPPAAVNGASRPRRAAEAAGAMDVTRAAQLAISMTKAERDVVRHWAWKQTSDPDLCNIGAKGRLSAYAVLKWAEAAQAAGGKKP